MKNQKIIYFFSYLFLLLQLLISGCSASRTEGINRFALLKNKIHDRFNDSLFQHAHWGVLIKSLKTGKVWYEQNADKMFMPASNEKILTSSAALIELGPDFQFETYLTYSGNLKDSVLEGDIIVFGNGDPTLYNRFNNNPKDVFIKWAEDLRSLGIKKITGNIIGDDNAFDDNHIGYGWSFDGLDAWYSAEVGALQLNENYVDLKIIPPLTINDSLQIIPNLLSKYYEIKNQIEIIDTGRSRLSVERPFGSNSILLNGYIKAGDQPFEETPSLTNPTLFYVTVLKEVFEEEGIEITAQSVDCDDIENWIHKPQDFNLLSIHKSPPLREILSGLMKRSQNMYAETMVRVLGWKEFGLGSFRNGKKVVEKVLKNNFGIEPGTYAFMDGSGLTRYDYVSPNQIVKIMEGMTKHKYWEVWRNALPIAGVDGTLKNRMKGTSAEGNVRAKTGTISNVRGLSGYVTTADAEQLVFSFLVNGHLLSSKETEDVTDSVLEMIAAFSDIPPYPPSKGE
jgi:D-alanyl-D-alanine carboxypeptidase/D-alanyl-D-alanine-endopeptidase (penicillin-binding protein 4)